MTERIKIVREGVRQHNDLIIQREALYLEDSAIPVLLNGYVDHEVGYARDIQRDEDGWLSMDVTLRIDFLERVSLGDDEKISDWYEFSAYAGEVKRAVNLVTSARLRAVYMIPIPGIPRVVAERMLS